MTYVLRKGYY